MLNISKYRRELIILSIIQGLFGAALVLWGLILHSKLYVPERSIPISPEMYGSLMAIIRTHTLAILPLCGALFVCSAFLVLRGIKLLKN